MGPYYCHSNQSVDLIPERFVEDPDDDMQEPVECPGCGKWGELQAMRGCRTCREFYCPECIAWKPGEPLCGPCIKCDPELFS